MSTLWDRVAEASPIDRVARAVVLPGDHFTFTTNAVRSANPLPTRQTTGNAEIIGKTFGRLTVVGLSATIRGSWVVRCACGYYETKKMRSLMDPDKANRLLCSHCNLLEERKAGRGPWLKEAQ